jgi:hypothetical protein
MHLYMIDTGEHDRIHVVARSSHEAADLFVSWSAARDRVHQRFRVECAHLTSLSPQQQIQVRSAFSAGLVGVAHFDNEVGWTFSPPMWVPLGADHQPVRDEGASS